MVFLSHFLFELFFPIYKMEVPILVPPGLLGSTQMLMEVGSSEECSGLRTWNLTFCAWLCSMTVEYSQNMQGPQSQLLSLSCFHLVRGQDHQLFTVHWFISILCEKNCSTSSESSLFGNPSCLSQILLTAVPSQVYTLQTLSSLPCLSSPPQLLPNLQKGE